MNTKRCEVALFDGVVNEVKLMQIDIPELQQGELLVRITCATICGSDLHTVQGKRKAQLPIVLGHEMVGVVEKIKGTGVIKDYWGQSVCEGSRITWSLVWSCGSCSRCLSGFPQKCYHLFKYGHEKFTNLRSLSGGFAEYCIIKKDTPLYVVSDFIEDKIVSPANCSMATAVSCVRQIKDFKSKSFLIQGGGLLGLMICALIKAENPLEIVLVDSKEERLELAKEFGADKVFCVSNENSHSDFTLSYKNKGFDVVFECSGSSEAMTDGLKKINVGGYYILAGAVFPVREKCLDPEKIIRKMVTLKGVHNYSPEDLAIALKFLESSYKALPYEKIVEKTFSLSQLNEAFLYASKATSLRTAVVN